MDPVVHTSSNVHASMSIVLDPHPLRQIRREIISALDAFGMHILICLVYDDNAVFIHPCPPTNKHACAIIGNAVMYMAVASSPHSEEREYRPSPKMMIPFLLTPDEGLQVLILRNARKCQEAYTHFKMPHIVDINPLLNIVSRIYSRFSYQPVPRKQPRLGVGHVQSTSHSGLHNKTNKTS